MCVFVVDVVDVVLLLLFLLFDVVVCCGCVFFGVYFNGDFDN